MASTNIGISSTLKKSIRRITIIWAIKYVIFYNCFFIRQFNLSKNGNYLWKAWWSMLFDSIKKIEIFANKNEKISKQNYIIWGSSAIIFTELRIWLEILWVWNGKKGRENRTEPEGVGVGVGSIAASYYSLCFSLNAVWKNSRLLMYGNYFPNHASSVNYVNLFNHLYLSSY